MSLLNSHLLLSIAIFFLLSLLHIFGPPLYPTPNHPRIPTTRVRRLMEPTPPRAADQQPNNHSPSPSSSSVPAMPSSQGSANTAHGLIGKHRMAAAISLLNQQIQIIQDELDELDTVDGVSTVCQELISSIDSVPDGLLPVTRGPSDVGWERWFQGAQSSRSRRRWI